MISCRGINSIVAEWHKKRQPGRGPFVVLGLLDAGLQFRDFLLVRLDLLELWAEADVARVLHLRRVN